MDTAQLTTDFSQFQDITGSLAQRIFTPICIFFPLQDDSAHSGIVDTLTKGLRRLCASFPFLAAQVIYMTTADGKPGRPKLEAWNQTSPLIVKDYTQDRSMPSMDTLRAARFPCTMLDGQRLTSMSGAPSCFESGEEPTPAFFVQANFINGGLILTLAGEHSVIDGQGLGQIIHMFSAACHDENFTKEQMLEGNRPRSNAIPLLDRSTYKPGPELNWHIAKPTISTESPSPSPPQSTWTYVHFSRPSLSTLKSRASNPTNPYITTNDALSAFIWRTTSRIRSRHFPTETTSTFGRAVDVRPSLSISPHYLGNMSNHTYTTLSFSQITSTPLSSLASILRSALNAPDLTYAMRSLATYLSYVPDISTVAYGSNMDFSRDVFFSSWAKLPCYSRDFNLGLGLPESVRRPGFMSIEGLMYLMPMDREGGIDAMICLQDADLEALREDGEFREFAEWVG